MGVGAVNLGRNDLAAGMAFVESIARDEKLPWVSANVRPASGEAAYPAFRVVAWGGRKVAVFGLAPMNAAGEGAVVDDPVASARDLLSRLPPVDMVVCLSDLGQQAERELMAALGGIALVIGGGEGARLLAEPEVSGDAVLLRAADRGRQLGVFEVGADALGSAWRRPVWEGAAADAERRAAELRRRLDSLGEKDAAAREPLRRGIERFEAARDAALAAPLRFRHRIVPLSSEVADDPAVRADVNRLRPRPAPPVRRPAGVPFFDRPATRRDRLDAPAKTPPAPPVREKSREVAPPPPLPEGEPTDVGTLTCRRCHREAYQKWFASKHARSLSDLPPGNRMDAACLPCHASTLFTAEGSRQEAMVGCESCHGPGSRHAGPGEIDRAPDVAGCRLCHRPHPRHPDTVFDFPKAYEAIRCDR